MKIERKVKDLKAGDVLDSGTVVIEKPFDQVRTPKGKTNLVVRYANSEVSKFVTWSKQTIVKVVIEDITA